METPAAQSESAQRRVELQHAEIKTDATSLHRTARFSDGSLRAVTMNWADVTRVAAFRRDVQTSAVVAIAVTDPANIVVLDEKMEGWSHLLEDLSAHLALTPGFTEWRGRASKEPLSSHWLILFPGQP
jgi:hypothetical protein